MTKLEIALHAFEFVLEVGVPVLADLVIPCVVTLVPSHSRKP